MLCCWFFDNFFPTQMNMGTVRTSIWCSIHGNESLAVELYSSPVLKTLDRAVPHPNNSWPESYISVTKQSIIGSDLLSTIAAEHAWLWWTIERHNFERISLKVSSSSTFKENCCSLGHNDMGPGLKSNISLRPIHVYMDTPTF